MTSHRRWLGREGEARAARFLETRGYRIVARNVRADRVEIDLIARRGGTLVFVEVKSRRGRIRGTECRGDGGKVGTRRGESRSGHSFDSVSTPRHGHAAEAVDVRKQQRLRRGARAWLAANAELARRTRGRRFDVVTVLFEGPLGDDGAVHEARNGTTAPEAARWSIEHWESAF